VIGFFRAHGYDPGPTQRPFTAGAITGLLATCPAAAVFLSFGSFEVAADQVLRLPRPWTAALLLGAFALAGLIYGAMFRRAANDRRAGWILGLSYAFVLWVAAPILVFPLIRGPGMAAGTAAVGFLGAFLVWGLVAGVLFPYVHRPLHAKLAEKRGAAAEQFGPETVTLKQRFLRRPG
jgi:hypothetical protein